MPIFINDLTIENDGNLKIKTAGGDPIYEQSTSGIVNMPRDNGGSTLLPMFYVGYRSANSQSFSGVNIWNDTGNPGYVNINNCYNTTNGRFTAPWTGLYLFKMHIYASGSDGSGAWYYHPLFLVNGSRTTRRPGSVPYRMRNYGLYASYGFDSDCCELIYLTANDYVQTEHVMSGSFVGAGTYSTFSGAYLGT